jgi:hypothetical protein
MTGALVQLRNARLLCEFVWTFPSLDAAAAVCRGRSRSRLGEVAP